MLTSQNTSAADTSEGSPGRTIVLLACVKSKLAHKARARELYTSALFRKSLAFAQRLQPDAIYILSAKYGLVALDQEIEPYEVTLNGAGVAARQAWARQVLADLRQQTDLENDQFIILAGQRYREYLLPSIRHYTLPLEGLALGQQLQALSR